MTRQPISKPSDSTLDEPLRQAVLRLEGAAQNYGSAAAMLPNGIQAQRALAAWDVRRVELEDLIASTWRCFHCGDVFTRELDAAEHFGGQLNALAGCQVKGHELTLLGYVRELEVAVNRWIDDRHPLQLAMAQLEAEHAAALRKAEEDGYNRGVQDMKREGLGVIA